HRLEWVEDPTNMETRFARNFLRAKVMPLIREQWQGADESIARRARHMAEANALLGELALAGLSRAVDGEGLHVAALRALPHARRGNALRAWIASFDVEVPSTAQALEIGGRLLAAREDANPEFRWAGARIRRERGRLHLQVNSRDRIDSTLDLIS